MIDAAPPGLRVLFYHRVNPYPFASLGPVSREITVTPEVFSRQLAYLKALDLGIPVGDEGDLLGYSVAVSGETVVVGAYGEDSNATGVNGDQTDNSSFNSGAAYVFVRTGSVWSQQAYLKPE